MRNNFSTLFWLSAGFLISFFVANRPPESFFDTNNYIEMATSAANGFEVNAEPSFAFLSNVSFIFGTGAVGLLFAYAVLGIVPKLILIIRRLPYQYLALLLYLSGNFILQEMVQIRVGAALGLLWLSMYLFSDGRIFWSISLSIFAMFLHYSAFIVFAFAIVMIFLYLNKFLMLGRLGNDKLILAIFMIVVSYLIGLAALNLTSSESLIYDYLPNRYADGYLVSSSDSYGIGRIIYVVFISTLGIFSCALGWLPRQFPYLFAALSAYISLIFMCLFQSQPVVGSRLADMFLSFLPILIVGIIKSKPRIGWPVFLTVLFAQAINILFYATYYQAIN